MLDVYSFGVLLLEIITGKDVALHYEGVKSHLSEVIAPFISEGQNNDKLRDFVDNSLAEDYLADEAMSMVVLVDHCLKEDPGNRPSMGEIVQTLSMSMTQSVTFGSTSAITTSS